MVTEVATNPNKDCSAFQFGPGTTDIPGCSGGSHLGSLALSSVIVIAVMLFLGNGL
jgi:hypothetical protein